MSSNRTREDFLRFLDFLGEKGLIPTATAASRKATANKVTAILSEEEAQDVTALDLDILMNRFHNLNSQAYTPESLQTYKSRMRTALDDFRSYTKDPINFKPAGQKRTKPKQNGEKPASSTLKGSPLPTSSPSAVTAPMPSLEVLPVAIRSNLTVQIVGLPFDLTTAEAKKIANIILAHAALQD